MPPSSPPRRHVASSVLDGVRGLLHRWGIGSQSALTVLLVALTPAASAGMVLARSWVPPTTFVLIELLGAFLLRMRGMLVLCAAIVVQVLAIALGGFGDFTPGTLLLQGIAVVALLSFAAHRERLGLQGAPGDLMIVDLRDRLAAQGAIPVLPDGWVVQTALVDVSGKGQAAGVRSLRLSGAFAGLVGAMRSADFLPAANAYLLGQAWDEGFATAVHLTLTLGTGEFTIASAGHVPPVQLHAGSGLVEVLDTAGSPALGIVADVPFPALHGRLGPGDVLLLYTDGLVEVPGEDLDQGIDRLTGVAEELLATRRGDAEAVLDHVRAGEGDDRALVLVRRD